MRRSAVWGLSWLLWLAVVSWAYWPGLGGPSLLDDHENLKSLQRLEQSSAYWPDVIAGNRSGPLGRPLSMASFAIERLLTDGGARTQKTVGLLIHLINGQLVVLLSLCLFRTAGLEQPVPLALISGGLWLSMPLLLSTTLYIVQRMTLLSAGFSLLALYGYCRGRERQLSGRSGRSWFAVAAVAVVPATLSKENGVLAVPLMSVLECCFFRFRAPSPRSRSVLKWFHVSAVALPSALLALLLTVAPERLPGGYEFRDFTPFERLLTEAPILWDYLRQILYPQVSGLGVYHDDWRVSRSLADPPVTLPAVLGWLLVAVLVARGVLRDNCRWPAFGFGFFLVGHAVESTVVGLEPYFEHRNYLPAAGVAMALVGLAGAGIGGMRALKPWLLFALFALMGRNLWLLSSQAVVWSNTWLLHVDAYNSHPESSRVRFELARLLARDGELELALEMVEGSEIMLGASDFHRAIVYSIYHCHSNRPLPEDLWRVSRPSREVLANIHTSRRLGYLARMLIDDRCDRIDAAAIADGVRDALLSDGEPRGTPMMLGAMILLENRLRRYRPALRYAERLLERAPRDVMALQFKLYLATVLELAPERDMALGELRRLRDMGRLNRQETHNLELFEEPAAESANF